MPQSGQTWTTHEKLLEKHSVKIKKINEHLYELLVNPGFSIGQRALLILSESGNILWDCIPLLDEGLVEFINTKGGLKAIAFSHPHYYSNMKMWAETFNCTIYIHENDRQWVANGGDFIEYWPGNQLELWDQLKLHNIGGHFEGSSIIEIPWMSENGTLLIGDTMYLSPSMKHFATMRSYPNRIPLPLHEIRRIEKRFEEIQYDTIYGFYPYQNVNNNAKEIVRSSFAAYQ
ncbi:MBL fold metallo-hydrolase [Chryseobacterium sp. T16E-39]|nr:MBL fold metallo-hydrolase [Chryseobacterium sp. T16E-39]